MENDPWAEFSSEEKDDPWAEFEDATPEIKSEPKVRFQSQPPEDTFLSRNLPSWMVQNKREVVTMDGPKGQEQIMDLPTPSENMYDGLSQEDMNALYDAYMRHPKTADGTYKQRIVPLPLRDRSSGVTGGVYETGRNIVEAGAALGETVGILPEGSTETVNTALPHYQPKRTGQKIGSLVGQVVGAGGLEAKIFQGLAAGAKAGQAAGVLPKVKEAATVVAKTAAHIFATFVSAGASFSNSQGMVKKDGEVSVPNENWFVGNENAWVFEGLDGKSESEAQAVIEDRLNTAMDAAVLAAPVEMLAAGGKKLGQLAYSMFLENFHGAVSADKNRQLVMRQFMDQVYKVTNASTPQERKVLNEQLVTMLKDPKNKSIILDIGEEGIDNLNVPLDTTTAVRRGLGGDNSEMAGNIKKVFEKEKTNIITRGQGTQLETVANRPTETLKDVFKQTDEVFDPAGRNSQAAGKMLERTGQERVGQSMANIEETAGQIDDLNTRLPDDLVATPTGSKIQEVANTPSSQSGVSAESALSDVGQSIDEGNKAINATADALYEKIPEGQAFMSGDYEKRIRKIVETHGNVFPKELRDAMINSQSDFAKVIKTVRPSLVKEINALEKIAKNGGQRPSQLDDLIELKKYIIQIEPGNMEKYVNIKGNKRQEVVDAFREAEDYYKGTKATTVLQGVPADFAKTESKIKFDAPKKADVKRQKLLSGMKNPNTVSHLIKTLKRPEYKMSHGKVMDYIKSDIADSLRTELKLGEGIKGIDSKKVLDLIEKHRTALRAEGLAEEAKQLDQFEDILLKNRGQVKNIEKFLETQKFNHSELLEDTYGNLLSDFFTKSGETKGDIPESFNTLFSGKNKNKILRLNKLVQESGDDAVKDGWRAAYMKQLGKRILPDEGVTQVKGTADSLLDDNSLLAIGDEIFKDKPNVIAAVRQLLEPAVANAADAKRRPPGSSVGKALTDAKRDAGALNKMWFGPLTRAGTVVNALVGRALDTMDPNAIRSTFRERIMMDPDAFADSIEKFMAEKEPSRKMRIAFNYMVRAGLMQEEDYDEYQSSILNDK